MINHRKMRTSQQPIKLHIIRKVLTKAVQIVSVTKLERFFPKVIGI